MRVGVRDQGVRIAEPDQQRIFEKFVRLDPNLTSGVSGTGVHIAGGSWAGWAAL